MTRTIVEVPLDSIVDHPDQPRYGVGDVEALADSIANVGLLEPVLVVKDEAESYRVLAGHRRVAAMRHLGRTEIPAVDLVEMIGFGRNPSTKELDEIAAIMASNTAREALTPLEEARGYQTMIEFGLKADMVARISGTKKKRVDRLSKAITQLGRERSDELAAKEPQLSIEHLEGLAQFAGDDVQYAKLVKALEEKPARFESDLRTAEWELKHEQEREANLAKVREAGVTVVEVIPATGEWLGDLNDAQGAQLNVTNHGDCPGHAAICVWNGTPRYICTDWRAHGHVQRYTGGNDTDWEKRRAEAQARRDELEKLAVPRRAFVSGLLQQKDLHGGLHYFAVSLVWEDCASYVAGVDRLLALQLLGWEYDDTAKRRWVQSGPESLPANASGDDVARALTAVVVANLEQSCADWNEHDDEAVKYLRLLKGAGYELSELEHAIAWPAKDEQPAEPPADVDPETGEVAADMFAVIAVRPGCAGEYETAVGPTTQYAELIADYLASVEAQALVGEFRDPESWRVVAERELTDPEKEYGRREPHDVIWSGDYGQRLRVVAADQGGASEAAEA